MNRNTRTALLLALIALGFFLAVIARQFLHGVAG
ncbi:cytochrome oxidase small assembly protein [Jeongeupia sp. USM3]|nr:cytochrome oxidase small assembly protein [Jeongeupia sp. USM3]